MNQSAPVPQKQGVGRQAAPSARELLQLPAEERTRILIEQAAALEEEYRTNTDLTGFEAFGEADLYDETPIDGTG